MPVSDDPTVIAALGVYRHLEGAAFPDPVADPHWAHRIRRAVSRGTVLVSVGQALLSDTQLPDALADELRIAWDQGVAEFHDSPWNPGLRVFIETPGRAIEHTVTTLIRGATGVDSVVLTDRTLEGPIRWDWPLKVSVVGDDVTNAVKSYRYQQLIAVDTDSKPSNRYDLLILESTDHPHLTEAYRAGVGFLLLFVNSSDVLRADTLRQLNETIRFRAGAVVRWPDDIDAFVDCFLDGLAHDYPPDVATVNAAVNVNGDANDALVIGDPTFLSQARVSVVSAAIEGVIEQHYTAGEIERNELTAAMETMEAMYAHTAPEWLAESGAATDSVEKLTTVRTMMPALTRGSASAVATGRCLQAQVFEHSNAGLVQRTQSFEANACHEVRVRIGPTGMDWISMPHRFPVKELPSTESHLTVRMLVPSPMQEPDMQEIKMATTGASTVARFEIDIPMDMEHLEATIIVLYQGKHLQTGTLSGPVTRGQLAPAATGITFTRGAASAADLEHQRPFDLTIWKNRDELVLNVYKPSARGDEPTHVKREPSLAGIDAVLDGIRDELFFAAQKLDRPGTSLESAGLPMIRSLARQGRYLRRKLFGDDAMQYVRRVQVASPLSSDFFPVDFLYDYERPKGDANLCPEFKRVDGPDCTDACRARAGDAQVVCPSGFWALNRIIERQVRPKDHADCHQPESTAQHPELMNLGGIIFAASNEVNEGDPKRVKDTVAKMKKVAPVYHATTWSAWEKLVTDHYPCLLVALPHNIEEKPFHMLQIATNEDLALDEIERTHVAPRGAPVGAAVLLLGCNTANAQVQYYDFVNEFRCAGAALVIGTLTYVLGPQAARMASEFVTQIWATSESKTIGEIMREVRGRMLVADNPMALAITAFGDADWRFRI
jgi:hypothetical protein